MVLLVFFAWLKNFATARTRSRASRAADAARQRVANSESTDAVARWLASEAHLPPLAAVRALADAADILPEAALETMRPYLSANTLDLVDRMPAERFNRAMRDLSAR